MPDEEKIKAEADAAFRAGQIDHACELYRQVLSHRPNWAAAHNNLAMALRILGDNNGAEHHFRKALDVNPDQVGTLSNLGALMLEIGKLEDAAATLDHAIAVDPGHPGSKYNRAKVFAELGKTEDQKSALQDAVRLQPDFAEALTDLAQAYRKAGRLEEVESLLRRAIAAKPNLHEPRINLGSFLSETGRGEEAVATLRDAIALVPGNASAHYNLANALTSIPAHKAALAAHSEALRLNPSLADAANNMAKNYQALGRMDEARTALENALRIDPMFADAASNLLMLEHYDPASTPESRFVQAQTWQENHRDTNRAVKNREAYRQTNHPDPNRPIRVGFVSPNLNRHPVGYFLTPLVEALNDRGIVVSFYCQNLTSDDVTDRLRARSDQWHDISGLAHTTVSDLVEEHQIDILFDLAGHTGNNRMPVFTARAAPVQVTWAGYVGTTGLDAMDHLLTDKRQTLDSDLSFMTESPVYMPGNYVPCLLPDDIRVAEKPPMAKAGRITFGCFNNAKKLNSPVIALWSSILDQVENSVLKLITEDLGDPDVGQWIAEEFSRHGVAADRLDFRGKLHHGDLLASYNSIDIALDPFPYSGGLTTLEALWMGVPVITRSDADRFAGRHSITHLTAVGVPELIGADAVEYQQLAVDLAHDTERLAEYKSGLREKVRTSPVCDGPAFARHFSHACRLMWQQWCRGEDPSAIPQEAIAAAP